MITGLITCSLLTSFTSFFSLLTPLLVFPILFNKLLALESLSQCLFLGEFKLWHSLFKETSVSLAYTETALPFISLGTPSCVLTPAYTSPLVLLQSRLWIQFGFSWVIILHLWEERTKGSKKECDMLSSGCVYAEVWLIWAWFRAKKLFITVPDLDGLLHHNAALNLSSMVTGGWGFQKDY